MPINDINHLENMVQLYHGRLSRLELNREVLDQIFESPERLIMDIQKIGNDYSLTIYTKHYKSENDFFRGKHMKPKWMQN